LHVTIGHAEHAYTFGGVVGDHGDGAVEGVLLRDADFDGLELPRGAGETVSGSLRAAPVFDVQSGVCAAFRFLHDCLDVVTGVT